MANETENGFSYETIQAIACTASLHGQYFFFSLTAVNIVLAITASLGNAVILFSLQRETSLHPPSKLMFQGLTASVLLHNLCLSYSSLQQRIIEFNFVSPSWASMTSLARV